MKVTREQALAFVDALTGTHGDGPGVPNSIAARTHLLAVLGLGGLPWVDWDNENADWQEGAVGGAFLDYVQGCINTLRPEGHGTCGTCVFAGTYLDYNNTPICAKLSNDFDKELLREGLPPGFGCRYWCNAEPAETVIPQRNALRPGGTDSKGGKSDG